MAALEFQIEDHNFRDGPVVRIFRDGERVASLCDDGNGNLRLISHLLIDTRVESIMEDISPLLVGIAGAMGVGTEELESTTVLNIGLTKRPGETEKQVLAEAQHPSKTGTIIARERG